MFNEKDINNIEQKISCGLSNIIDIQSKDIAEKICIQLLRYMPGIYVSSFGGDVKLVLNKILDQVIVEDANLDIDVINKLLKRLSIVPEYLVEMNEDAYNLSKQYYLKIEFINCPAEEIMIHNEVLQGIKQSYPHTRLFIVTPYDNVFYSLDIDDINDGENLDLKNHTIEDMYPILTDEICDDCEEDILLILYNDKTLVKSLFGTLNWGIQ